MDRLPTRAVSLLGLAIGSDAVLLEEAHGQCALVGGTQLPADMGGERAAFESMGIRFKYLMDDAGKPVSVETVEGDPLFCEAALPPGWSKRVTDHSMWSELVDDRGRRRASVFYKAAFYDRSAHMHPVRRYAVSRVSKDTRDATQWGVLDGEVLLWASERVLEPPESATRERRAEHRGRSDALRAQAVAWLDERRPDWKNPLAYWDEP